VSESVSRKHRIHQWQRDAKGLPRSGTERSSMCPPCCATIRNTIAYPTFALGGEERLERAVLDLSAHPSA